MKASCQCGQLTATLPGPTIAVVACHCIACQRRTGSPFGLAAYYPHDQITIHGSAQRYDRKTDLDGIFENYFCATCGSTLYFRGTKNPDVTGIALGAVVDPHEMVPIRSVWEQSRHPWVSISTAMEHFEKGRV
jgi:hypothetical protein